MKASELIKILEKRPNAEVMVIAGKGERTYVVDGAGVMAHTIIVTAANTPYEHDNT